MDDILHCLACFGGVDGVEGVGLEWITVGGRYLFFLFFFLPLFVFCHLRCLEVFVVEEVVSVMIS